MAERLSLLAVEAVSPDAAISATARGPGDVRVSFAPGVYRQYRAAALARQLEALTTALWVRYRRRYLEIVSSWTDRDEKPEATDEDREFERQLVELQVIGVSARGRVTVRSHALELRFRVTVLDPAGGQAPGGEETAYGGVLSPGGELASAGGLHVSKDQKVGSLRVQVVDFGAYPPGNFSGWAQTEVIDLTRGKPDALGRFDVGAVVAQPGLTAAIGAALLGRPRPAPPAAASTSRAPTFTAGACFSSSPCSWPSRFAHCQQLSHVCPAQGLSVDRTWQNPNRIPAAQGPIVTLPAVRRRTP